MRLKGKTALIAGAGRGNGKAIALAFAREGADLILIARVLGDELNQVAKQCEASGVRALPVLADISNPEEVQRGAQLGLERFGKVDVLVCVAGIRPHKPVWEYGYDEWHHIFAVNLHSAFYFAKILAPGMIERKSGSIIALAGVSALSAFRNGASEAARGHGLYGLIKSLALDLGPHGIRANLLVLSRIENERRNPEWYKQSTLDVQGEVAHAPLRRRGSTQEVANVAVFLASEESSYITGDRICCAGGRYM